MSMLHDVYIYIYRYDIYKCLDLDMNLFTTDPRQSFIHVVTMGDVSFNRYVIDLSIYPAITINSISINKISYLLLLQFFIQNGRALFFLLSNV